MRKYLAPLVTSLMALLLTACAGHGPDSRGLAAHSKKVSDQLHRRLVAPVQPETGILPAAEDDEVVQLETDDPDGMIARGFSLIGTPYRIGGESARTGFDCSGFVGFLFREEMGIQLPRSTREMIQLDVPRVSRGELKLGDVIFFNRRGRGQVSHVGIYIGHNRFIHASSTRSGGVRVDSLDSAYWRSSYMQAKRVLGETPDA